MKNVVFIVNLSEELKPNRTNPYQYSVKSWKTWCEKNNCELVVLDERIHPESFMNANWHKIFALQLLDSSDIDYNQVLIADADTMIHPNAPNIFELTNDEFCAVHGFGSYDWECRSIENYQKHLFHISDYLKQIPIAWKINIVVSNQDDLNINIGSLKNVHLYFKPDNFYEMLQESSAAIISGGILLQEAIYLGIPSFIIPQYEHQFEISQGHLREKVCIGVSQINPDYKSAINSIVN